MLRNHVQPRSATLGVLPGTLAQLLRRLLVGALAAGVHVVHAAAVLPDALRKRAGLRFRARLARTPARIKPVRAASARARWMLRRLRTSPSAASHTHILLCPPTPLQQFRCPAGRQRVCFRPAPDALMGACSGARLRKP